MHSCVPRQRAGHEPRHTYPRFGESCKKELMVCIELVFWKIMDVDGCEVMTEKGQDIGYILLFGT